MQNFCQVEYAIRDCNEMDDWVGQCQLLLRATHGMDYHEFYSFLHTVARRRIDCLTGEENFHVKNILNILSRFLILPLQCPQISS